MSSLTLSFILTDSSLVLFAAIIVSYLYIKHFHATQPLVHPLLLRKQSEVSQVRQQGQSGVYRNWATGGTGVLSSRPATGINKVSDLLVKPSAGSEADLGRKRLILGQQLNNVDLELLARRALANLSRHFPNPSHLILLPTTTSSGSDLRPGGPETDSRPEFLPYLVIHLAKSLAGPGRGFNLSILDSPSLLVKALEDIAASDAVMGQGEQSGRVDLPVVVIPNETLLEDVLEQVVDDQAISSTDKVNAGVIILGDRQAFGGSSDIIQRARQAGVKVVWWKETIVGDLDAAPSGKLAAAVKEGPSIEQDVHCFAYTEGLSDGPLVITQENVTAGIAGLLSIFPAHKRPSTSTRDAIITSQGINTPFGLTLMLASVYCGAGFIASENDDLPANSGLDPTIAFLRPKQLEHLTSAIERRTRSHPLPRFASRHLASHLEQGSLCRSGWLERLIWSGNRGTEADQLRAVYVIGDAPSQDLVTRAQLALSLPVGRLYASTRCAGPVFATHMHDLQSLPILMHRTNADGKESAVCHAGAPASNIEVVLRGDEVEGGDAGNDPEGEIGIRGPSVLQVRSNEGFENQSSAQPTQLQQHWTWTGREARALTNGTFVIIDAS